MGFAPRACRGGRGKSDSQPSRVRDAVGYHSAGSAGDSEPSVARARLELIAERLLRVTREALAAGIAQARAGNHVVDIRHAVQRVAQGAGYSVVRGLVGHGIGSSFHAEPQVPNYGKPKRGPDSFPG